MSIFSKKSKVDASLDDILPVAGTSTSRPAVGHYRWRVCAMLFAITTMNYLSRQVLGVLAPYLQQHLGWSQLDYGYIVTAFEGAYAIGLLCAGAVIDRLGTRIGYAIAIVVWSLAAMGHALVTTVIGFAIARIVLGLGEAGNFPAAVKAVGEWFPRRERALAVGVFNAGTNVGAVVAAVLVPIITVTMGWQATFVFTGALSGIWVFVWLWWYRAPEQQPAVSAAEMAYIRSDPMEPVVHVRWLRLLRHRQAWAFVMAKFMTDPVWWFLLFWIPKFLHHAYGLSLLSLGPPLIVIFVLADIGSVGGGWIAGRFVKRGWTANRARKAAMAICAVAVVPIVFVAHATHLWVAVALIGLAAAAHQGWSANVLTLPTDMFPRQAVASVVGIGGFAGAVGGMLIATFTGFVLQTTGSYVPMFMMAGSAYLLALLVVHLLVPRLQPAQFDNQPAAAP